MKTTEQYVASEDKNIKTTEQYVASEDTKK